jgi:hypothetical protein
VKNLLLLTFILFLFSFCNSEDKPKDLISEDKMVEVLVDIHMTEGTVSAMPIAYDSSQRLYKLLEKDLFLKHDIIDSVFQENMIFYLSDPSVMDRIYSRVIDSLTVKESKFRTTEGKEELL